MFNWRVFSKQSLSKASAITVASFFIFCSLKAYSAPIPEKAMVFFWAKDIEKQGANDRRPLGSGFLVSNEGVILTAKHVIESIVKGEQIIASISGKSTFPVPIDETDIHCAMANRDVCTVRIPPDAIPTSVTSFFKPECGKLETMTKLHAMGFTGGADRFGGVIRPSGEVIGRAVTGGLIPTDLDLVPTMSGGPVLNSRNNVVALVKGADSTSHNLTFVTPITSVRSILMNLNVQCIIVNENSGEREKLIKELATLLKISKEVDFSITHQKLRVIPALKQYSYDTNSRSWSEVVNAVSAAHDRLEKAIAMEVEFAASLDTESATGELQNLIDTISGANHDMGRLVRKRYEGNAKFRFAEGIATGHTSRSITYRMLSGTPIKPSEVSKHINRLQSIATNLRKNIAAMITHYKVKIASLSA